MKNKTDNKDSHPLVAQMVKHLPIMQEAQVGSLDQEDSLEKGMATHCSILAWRLPWTEKPGGLQSLGSYRVGHDWATNTSKDSIHVLRDWPWFLRRTRYRVEGPGPAGGLVSGSPSPEPQAHRKTGLSVEPDHTSSKGKTNSIGAEGAPHASLFRDRC